MATKVREEYDDVQSEPVFNRLPGDLQIEFRRLIANGRKRTKGRAKFFKASTVDPMLVQELAKVMSFEKIQDMLMFTGTTKELDAAYKRGRADAVGMVGDKLYQLAMEGVAWAVKMYLMSRDPKTWRDTAAPVQPEEQQQMQDPYACLATRSSEDLLKIVDGR